jgi:hypothetical protein
MASNSALNSPTPKAARAVPLDDLEEEGRAILDGRVAPACITHLVEQH